MTLPATAFQVVEALRAAGATVAVAESLTGGLLANAFVEVPGSSTVFRGGIVAYATALKATLLGVPAELLAARGPVDADVAAAMAAGVRRRCGADWGLSTTGVAGPQPQGGAPVGRVHVAVVGPAGRWSRTLDLSGDRQAVRNGTVQAVLEELGAHLPGLRR
ncbi:MAG TPA: CinA family protein [Pilimelia sp.]|nr:CinA family protein [Pilimelia sp.]